MKLKPMTKIGLGGAVLAALAISATVEPGSDDPSFVTGYYTGRLLMLIAGVWLIVKGLIERKRGDD